MKKIEYEEVKKYIESFGCLLVSEEYNGNTSLLKIKCKCGNTFEKKLSDIKYNNYCLCNECYLIYKSEDSFNDFIKELDEIGYNYLSRREDYKNSKSLVDVKCDKGHEIKTSKNKIQSGQRCKYCNKEKNKKRKIRKDFSIVKEEIENSNYKILTSKEDYKGTKSEILLECENGHIYPTCYNVFHGGHRCPYCNESKGEKAIKEFLEKFNIEYESQYRFENCKLRYPLPFDFYLPKCNIAIEFDGIQHFKPIDFAGKGKEWAMDRFISTIIHDTVKNEYCKKNNIKLIRISYQHCSKIAQILKLELNLK